MNINDLIVIGSSIIATMLMISSALTVRRRPTSRVKLKEVRPTVTEAKPIIALENLLSNKIVNFVEGYPDVKGRMFKVELPQLIAPKGFERVWECIKLDCGGWGCAYKCRDERGRVVVFKVPRGLESIIEEAEILSRLKHPHVLRLLGYSTRAPILV